MFNDLKLWITEELLVATVRKSTYELVLTPNLGRTGEKMVDSPNQDLMLTMKIQN